MERYSEGILVTLGQDQVKEKGYKAIIEDFLRCDGENFIYNWRLHAKPKKDFVNVYIVVGNKIRWKATFVGYESGKINFRDGRTMYSPVWMLLIDFVKLPAPYEIRRGFQGFRYK